MDTFARPPRPPDAGSSARHLEGYVADLVDAAPALTAEQARRLHVLLERSRSDAQPQQSAERRVRADRHGRR